MIKPVTSAQASHASQVSQSAARQPHPKQASQEIQGKVTLKSVQGDADQDGDSK
jgi:hypothetical protein